MLKHLLRNLLRRRHVDQDLDAEVDAYEEHLVAEKTAAGMPESAARRQARLDLGGRDAVKEAVRDRRAGAPIEQLLRDLRYAVRTLARSPTFTIFTLLTFALSIGGMSVIFTLVNAVFLKPLPYDRPDQLVMVLEASVEQPDNGFSVAAPNFVDWEKQNDVFQRMALYEYLGFNLSGDGEPEQVGGLRVSSGILGVLGVRPILGRGFTPADDSGSTGHVVVISHRLWARRFASDSAIVGRTIRLNQEPWVVIGVLPEAFAFTSRGQQVFVPIQLSREDNSRGSHSFFAVARLKDGVSVRQADAAMRVIGDRLARQYPDVNDGETAIAFPMRELWVQDTSETLQALMVAVALVLLIASANVAGLLVARGNARRREIAARLALGGTRRRVVSELVTESVVLAVVGAALGLVLALIGVRELIGILPQGMRSVPFRSITTVTLDFTVYAFAAITAILAGIAAGLPAALSVLPRDLSAALRDGSARGATGRRGQRLRGALVGFEVALAIVVLVGAGLLVSSIRRLQRVPPGLDPHHVMALNVELPQPDFYGPAVRTGWCDGLQRELGALPGLRSVSAISHVPLTGANAGRSFVIEGLPDPGNSLPNTWFGTACPGYFRTMGIAMKAGRDFTSDDRAGVPQVAVINETFRKRYFGDGDPIGRRVKLARFDTDAPWLTIVGVVDDVRHSGLQRELYPYLYATYPQNAWPRMSVMIRTEGNPLDLGQAARQALLKVAPEQPVGDAATMEVILDNSLGHLRFPMTLFSLFGLMAALLAALGVFGVATQAVLQRRRELGIRLALGAKASQLYGLVVRQVMAPVVFGMLFGVVGALTGTRVLRNLLYKIEPNDPRTISLGAVALGVVALVACLVPARRAARVDPAIVLRED